MRLSFITIIFHIVLVYASSNPREYGRFLKKYLKELNSSISSSCAQQLGKYVADLNNMQSWAIRMFDASSRIPQGPFSNKNTDLGDFDKCLDIRTDPGDDIIYGKYCYAKFQNQDLKREVNISLYNILAICFPSGCSDEDINKLWSGQATKNTVSDISCQVNTNSQGIGNRFFITMIFFIILLLMITYSTIYDIWVNYEAKTTNHKMLTAFSILTNGRNLISTNKYPGRIDCLNGIRVLALMWIMLGHRIDSYYTLPLKNFEYFINWFYFPSSQLVATIYPLNVNTFLLIGGAVVSYSFLISREKCEKFDIIRYYANRYLRLTTPLVAMVLIHGTTSFGLLGSGPLWPVTTKYMDTDCKLYWWSAFLYTQNYLNPLNLCIIPAWYLSVDMQLYISSPLILLSLSKFPKKSITVLINLIICLILLTFTIFWNNNILPVFQLSHKVYLLSSTEVANYVLLIYLPTHIRAVSWLIGIVLGYVLFQQRHKDATTVVNKSKMPVLWITAFLIFGFCVSFGYGLIRMGYIKLLYSLWGAVVNPLWCTFVFLVIFACTHGYGGPVNWFLSHPAFELLSKLSYCMFVTHFSLIQFRVGLIRQSVVFSYMEVIEQFFTDYVFSIILATFWYLAFEAPTAAIQSLYTKVHPCGICEKCQKLLKVNKDKHHRE